MKTAGEVISRHESYTLQEFALRTGMRGDAIRKCRDDGLTLVKIGLRKFIRGADWLTYLESKAQLSCTAGDK